MQKYRRALDIITQESGLPESSILDIRGNHDAFDMGQRYCLIPPSLSFITLRCLQGI